MSIEYVFSPQTPEVLPSSFEVGIQNGDEFFADFIASSKLMIDQPFSEDSQVIVKCSNFTPDPLTEEFIESMKTLARAGVPTKLIVDHATIIGMDKSKGNVLHDLENTGIQISSLNSQSWAKKIVKYADSDHTKIYTMQSPGLNIGWIGSANISPTGVSMPETMIKFTDAETTDYLANLAIQKIIQPKSPDAIHNLQVGQLVMDNGNAGQSAIMDAAVDMITQAKLGSNIHVVSPFLIGGKILDPLLQAIERGSHVNIYCEHDCMIKTQKAALMRKIDRFTQRNRLMNLPINFLKKRFHSKYIFVDNGFDQGDVLIGSHNFIQMNIVGTSEIAYRTQEPQVLKDLKTFHNTHII